MGFLECASGASVWREYDYYKDKKVASLKETDENIYSATVTCSSSESLHEMYIIIFQP